MSVLLGIDIGGSGIKGAPVDTGTGAFAHERFKVLTPQPSTPEAVAAAAAEVARAFDDASSGGGAAGSGAASGGAAPGGGASSGGAAPGSAASGSAASGSAASGSAASGSAASDGGEPVGVTFPGVVSGGVIRTAANLDHGWVGVDAAKLFGEALGRPVTVINDADAAGIAELRFGAAAGRAGVVVLLTFGTGIGSAVFIDGHLLPNTEFGHIEIDGKDAETRASAHARELHDLSWGKWAGRVNDYLAHLEALISPDLIVIGGGISRKSDKFMPLLTTHAEVVPAKLHNDAGIVGAALAAAAPPAAT
jgi:polyphosphate glucokinase